MENVLAVYKEKMIGGGGRHGEEEMQVFLCMEVWSFLHVVSV